GPVGLLGHLLRRPGRHRVLLADANRLAVVLAGRLQLPVQPGGLGRPPVALLPLPQHVLVAVEHLLADQDCLAAVGGDERGDGPLEVADAAEAVAAQAGGELLARAVQRRLHAKRCAEPAPSVAACYRASCRAAQQRPVLTVSPVYLLKAVELALGPLALLHRGSPLLGFGDVPLDRGPERAHAAGSAGRGGPG